MQELRASDAEDSAAARAPTAIPAASFAAGVLLDGLGVAFSSTTWAAAALVAAAIALVSRRVNPRSLSGSGGTSFQTLASLPVVATAAALLCLGGFWHHWRWHDTRADDFSLLAAEEPAPVVARFRLLDSPRELPPSGFSRPGDPPFWKASVEANTVRDGSEWRTVSGTGTLIFPFDGPVGSVGDRVEARGLLAAVAGPKNPGEADWRAMARGDGETFAFRVRYPESVELFARRTALDPRGWLEAARDATERIFFETMSPSSAAAATALIVGRRDRMDREDREDFFLTGAVHLLAISGMHVSILIVGLRFLAQLAGLSRGRTAALIFGATAAFAIFAAVQAPILRAATLILFAGFADLRGRRMTALQGLSIAALVVLVWRPWDLFDVGAQLSFLAVGALAWHSDRWRAWEFLRRERERRELERPGPWRQGFRFAWRWSLRIWTAGLCVWLATLPLVACQFHFVSLSAVPFNPFYALLCAIALYSAALTIPLWLVGGPLALPVAWIADRSLAALAWTLEVTSRLPYSFTWTAGPSVSTIVLTYSAGAAILLGLPKKRHVAAFALLVGLFAAATATDVAARRDASDVRITTLAVGHASAALIETREGAILCDAGFGGSPRIGARTIAAALWSSGRTHLDAVVISHQDADHFNSLAELTRFASIGIVYVPEGFFDGSDGLANELERVLDREGIPWETIRAGDALIAGEGITSDDDSAVPTIRVLHPPAGFVGDSDNAESVTLLVESAGQTVLLPGDLEKNGMERLLALDLPPIDVTLAPHHGSLNSLPERFAERTQAQIVVVSGDDLERWDEYAAAWSGTDARLYLTERDGAVRVELTSRGPRVRTYRADAW
ncbi:MAG TPA: ComEC/Rec2 family competence protein [Pirellulaceae bacterium]|jgi:competence protein ComEC|nr:ComEC/Rec2 family competence protein [Pirellulaceae bacterium]